MGPDKEIDVVPESRTIQNLGIVRNIRYPGCVFFDIGDYIVYKGVTSGIVGAKRKRTADPKIGDRKISCIKFNSSSGIGIAITGKVACGSIVTLGQGDPERYNYQYLRWFHFGVAGYG